MIAWLTWCGIGSSSGLRNATHLILSGGNGARHPLANEYDHDANEEQDQTKAMFKNRKRGHQDMSKNNINLQRKRMKNDQLAASPWEKQTTRWSSFHTIYSLLLSIITYFFTYQFISISIHTHSLTHTHTSLHHISKSIKNKSLHINIPWKETWWLLSS